jgi:hypothetical protein
VISSKGFLSACYFDAVYGDEGTGIKTLLRMIYEAILGEVAIIQIALAGKSLLRKIRQLTPAKTIVSLL